MRSLCDLTVIAPSNDTALIQQIHLVAAHAVCLLVERDLFAAAQVRPDTTAAAGTRSR
jgi:D-sedoheptulose 7-phosphate isomerase